MSTFAEFLHAFIQNNAAANTAPLPLMGPSGAQVWTAGVTTDHHPQPPVEKISVTDVPGELVVPRRHPRPSHSTRMLWA
jgi:hypothetical protein